MGGLAGHRSGAGTEPGAPPAADATLSETERRQHQRRAAV